MRNTGLLLFLTLSLWYSAYSQSDRCATMPLLQHKMSQDPQLAARMASVAENARWWRENHPESTGGPLFIPVVVHVVYTSALDSIPASRVYAQLDVLNRDYSRTNADTTNTRSQFRPFAADMGVQFCLATSDPNGNFTTGIEYTLGNPGFLGSFDPFQDNVKSSASGGADPWPSDRYLNLWVCELFPGLLGYAQFPGEDPLTDGVVIHYENFGTGPGTVAPGNLGRTATHEVGHWLGLYHIWGDGDCTVDDSIADTPDALDANYDCDTTLNTCTPASGTDYPDMIENYMDYSPDSCMSMFSSGQRTRAWSFLSTARAGLTSSGGCLPANRESERNSFHTLEIYPNPASGFIRLNAGPGWNFSNVSILDMKGALVASFSGNGGDISALPPGVYRLISVSGTEIASAKLLILR